MLEIITCSPYLLLFSISFFIYNYFFETIKKKEVKRLMLSEIAAKIKHNFQKISRDTRGQLGFDMSVLIGMALGIGVLILVFILIGVIGSKAYIQNEGDINSITNPTIKSNVETSITNSFGALKDASGFVSLVVLAVVFGIVLLVVTSAVGGAGYGRGAF